jgi:hypothetical protein
MQESVYPREGKSIWGSGAVALIVHFIAISVVTFLPTERGQIPPPEESITVEILTAPQMEEAPNQSGAEKNQTPLMSSQTSSETPSKGVMVQAKQYFSSKILADPRSKDALIKLRQLATDERITQLCNVEAMEQVHQWNGRFEPDLLVAYATADTKLSGLILEANGGALRSKRHWYNIKFKCEVAPNMEKVVAFEFAVGEQVPENEWENHFLPTGGAAD